MFGYGYYRKEEETDNERYLEGELERHRQAEERRSAEEERQRNARRQEEEEKKRQAEADALRARLEAIGEEIRLAVADRLAAESSEHGWTGVAQAIREGDYNNWLWW